MTNSDFGNIFAVWLFRPQMSAWIAAMPYYSILVLEYAYPAFVFICRLFLPAFQPARFIVQIVPNRMSGFRETVIEIIASYGV
jgi:hypothetical protein